MITAFILGLSGSMHCLVMCGPLHIALMNNKTLFLQRILLNLGRVFTYAALGLVVGVFGKFIPLFEMQQTVSIITGIAILLVYFIPKITGKEWHIKALNQFVVQSIGKVLRQNNKENRSWISYIMVGVLNGLLPCGLVFAALVASFSEITVINSLLFMVVFGLSTIPILLFVGMMSDQFKSLMSTSNAWRWITHAMVFVVALLFILRGLELGIPFISPEHIELYQNNSTSTCH